MTSCHAIEAEVVRRRRQKTGPGYTNPDGERENERELYNMRRTVYD